LRKSDETPEIKEVIEHKERSEKLLIAFVGSCWTFSESFQKRLDERRNVCIQYTVI
jgi:hypothetical protein